MGRHTSGNSTCAKTRHSDVPRLRATLVIPAGTLATIHLPMEGVAVQLGADAVPDTSINVLGNCR
jgi:Na+/H+-dicarboxylate symporter